jgi:hypothetical protein
MRKVRMSRVLGVLVCRGWWWWEGKGEEGCGFELCPEWEGDGGKRVRELVMLSRCRARSVRRLWKMDMVRGEIG